ncbi:Z1 domain-containing protein [Phascolarctobacterium faecium]|mgnify:FL=1|uniref:Z1 domain-containing protein n=1 Tax=Phascolarctobacterium faecium TaxID=33025 RepID=UPI003FED6FF0
MGYFLSYTDRIRTKGNENLAKSVTKTAEDIVPQYISKFSFKEHVVSLLVGDVQSGKTSHMFGLICAAADEGFNIFVLLTTDNIILQQQTLTRAKQDLCDFCICDENDFLPFLSNNMRKPVVVVLKKNSRILKQWKNNFSSTHFCAGNPLFIVDDEADAASLNTLVNKNKRSTINKVLEEIKNTTSSSIYMQVTGTPQAILLQSVQSGWKPYFVYYFDPGNGYLGGKFFFSDDISPYIIFTDNDEADGLLVDDEFPENGLKTALIMHLISAAHIFLSGGTVCNFLIHPSMETKQHSKFAEKIGDYLNEMLIAADEPDTLDAIYNVYLSLKETKADIYEFDKMADFIFEKLRNDEINILVLNSKSSFGENNRYESGINIIVGGNSLGRGITFPQLQTIYYCRLAKNPQADTMWQHARMFGYDRDAGLMRVFMPPLLYKLFLDINTTNNSIIAQIKKNSGNDIKICYPNRLKPTRKNVLDSKTVSVFSGGVNYFPFYPTNNDVSVIDNMLRTFSENVHSVSLKFIKTILAEISSEKDDWNKEAFMGFIKTILASNPSAQGKLIVRRERDISRGTGTLLSPNDRQLGDKYPNDVVLTLYKVTGTKGWNGEKLWIPNIKLPSDVVYYSG